MHGAALPAAGADHRLSRGRPPAARADHGPSARAGPSARRPGRALPRSALQPVEAGGAAGLEDVCARRASDVDLVEAKLLERQQLSAVSAPANDWIVEQQLSDLLEPSVDEVGDPDARRRPVRLRGRSDGVEQARDELLGRARPAWSRPLTGRGAERERPPVRRESRAGDQGEAAAIEPLLLAGGELANPELEVAAVGRAGVGESTAVRRDGWPEALPGQDGPLAGLEIVALDLSGQPGEAARAHDLSAGVEDRLAVGLPGWLTQDDAVGVARDEQLGPAVEVDLPDVGRVAAGRAGLTGRVEGGAARVGDPPTVGTPGRV